MAATIKDIARETGLSLATISKYLNGGNLREKNRAAIEAAIKKLGTGCVQRKKVPSPSSLRRSRA